MSHLAHKAPAGPHTAATGNALRITAAQRAIAAEMNGVTPDPDDLAESREIRISERLLHLSAATALRQALMSRPPMTGLASRRRRPIEQTTLDAYYLALALAAETEDDPSTLRATISRDHRTWLPAAALVGRLQVQFLEKVCAQLEVTANHLPVAKSVAALSAQAVFEAGGELTDTVSLLPDRCGTGSSGRWLYATSDVVIEGRSAVTVVEAGPSVLPAAWSARMAAPVTVTAADGRWPKGVVRDCLRLCDDAVRQWIGSMSRQLSGDNFEDLLLGVGPQLRWFLVSPAAQSIARMNATERQPARYPGQHDVWSSSRLPAVSPLAAAGTGHAVLGAADRSSRLVLMRQIDGEQELGPDTVIEDATLLSDIRGDAMVLLGAANPQWLAQPVEVTANLSLPDWEDVTQTVSRLSVAEVVELTAPVLAWVDRDVVAGDTRRLTLRARVHQGVPVRTPTGTGVFLAAGTRLSVLGTDISKSHCTVYLDQHRCAPISGAQASSDFADCVSVA